MSAPKIPEGLDKKYGAYKASEYWHGKNVKITDPNTPVKWEVEGDQFFEDINELEEFDYKKWYTLETKKAKQYHSAWEALKEFSPFNWRL